jgi:uncharacterized delta-60 repeat protein
MQAKISLIGTSLLIALILLLPNIIFSQTLDQTFDLDGWATIDFGNTEERAGSAVLQSNGKIVVAGSSYNGTSTEITIVRYNSNGSLDTSFDNDGKVSTNISSSPYGTSVALQSDGKIVVAGTSFGSNTFVARFNSNGIIDSSFDADGIATATIGSVSHNSLTIQSDGKIVLVGRISSGSNGQIAVIRYNSNGSLDNSFDLDGVVTTTIGTNSWASSLALQPDGKLVVTGNSDNGSDLDIVILRYNNDGSIDNTFDLDGIVTTTIGNDDDYAASISLQNDGKIVIAGTKMNPGGSTNASSIVVVRYNINGSLDTSFNANGKVITDIVNPDDDETVTSVVLQSDGKIMLTGRSYNGGMIGYFYMFLVRYNVNGSLDTNFGTNGVVTSSGSGTNCQGYSVIFQVDNKLVVAGTCGFLPNTDFAIFRYNNFPVNLEEISIRNKIIVYPNPFNSFTTIEF